MMKVLCFTPKRPLRLERKNPSSRTPVLNLIQDDPGSHQMGPEDETLNQEAQFQYYTKFAFGDIIWKTRNRIKNFVEVYRQHCKKVVKAYT